ncbi:hypothetical protein [Chitinophaga sp. YR573]|uniref:hypothetical protein n=1 Tax=Chitinophaga sp. YR573 TaxID=1881040 RepID=UPI000B7EA8B1|nr:hypothetical protein [Chitinophaga sp. YR573]
MSEGGKPPIPIPSVDRAWAGMEQLLDAELPVTSVRYNRLPGLKVLVMVMLMFSLKGGEESVSKISLKGQDDASLYVNNKQNKVAHNISVDNSLINADTISEINKNHLSDVKTGEISDTKNNTNKTEILNTNNRNKKEISDTRNNANKTEIVNTNNRNKKDISDTRNNANKTEILNADNKNKKEITSTKNNKHKTEILNTGKKNQKHKTEKQKEDFITDDNQNSFAGTPSSAPGTPWIYGSSPGFSRTALNLSTLPLHKEDPKKLMHKDMQISPLQTADKKDHPKVRTWSFWGQLNTPIPLYGSKYYSADPKGNNQFYRNLIPSIRIEKKIGKSSVSADLQPFTSLLLPLTVSPSNPDSTAPGDTLGVTVKRKMVKQFGSGITLQYHYPLYKNWTISGGIGGAWWQKAIVTQTKYDTTTVLAATKDDWKGYPRFIFTGTIELHYDIPKWQMGLRTAVPLNKSASDLGRRLQVEFLLRRRIR